MSEGTQNFGDGIHESESLRVNYWLGAFELRIISFFVAGVFGVSLETPV